MYDHRIHYCFTLSEEQLEYLRSKKYKIDRMECFMSLVELAERETKLVQISKTQQVEILPGQVMVDNTRLAKLWDKDRKTVPKLIEALENLGISSSQKVGDNRIHTLHAFSGWYVDGRFVKNPFATRRNADGTAIVTAEVPPARVLAIEVLDGSNKDAEGSDSDSDNSQGGNAGVIPSADSMVPHPSPQSNDSNNVGKSVEDERTSDSSQNNISHQSADIPSSNVEADGSQNEGKRNDDPSAQQEGQSQEPNGTQFKGNGGYNQKSNGYYNPNGFHSDE
ncbi:MAG: hypothetical protein Q4F47_02440 [Bacteroidaceae bacterium]|nr:hypothetical protein [Bacteroidaceae bacterium]